MENQTDRTFHPLSPNSLNTFCTRFRRSFTSTTVGGAARSAQSLMGQRSQVMFTSRSSMNWE